MTEKETKKKTTTPGMNVIRKKEEAKETVSE